MFNRAWFIERYRAFSEWIVRDGRECGDSVVKIVQREGGTLHALALLRKLRMMHVWQEVDGCFSSICVCCGKGFVDY